MLALRTTSAWRVRDALGADIPRLDVPSKTNGSARYGIDVRLPKTESGSDATEERLVVTVDQDNTIYLNERPVNLHLLTERLKTEMKRSGNDFVFLRADQEVPYGRVMLVMDQIKKAGADRVGMVTQQSSRPRKARSTGR